MVKCVTCGGTYQTAGADGHPYAHVCPPLSMTEITAAIAQGKIVLAPGDTADAAALRGAYPRANARNENPPAPAQLAALIAAQVPGTASNYGALANAIRATAIVSAGAGTVAV